jgi:hypothetical protein
MSGGWLLENCGGSVAGEGRATGGMEMGLTPGGMEMGLTPGGASPTPTGERRERREMTVRRQTRRVLKGAAAAFRVRASAVEGRSNG